MSDVRSTSLRSPLRSPQRQIRQRARSEPVQGLKCSICFGQFRKPKRLPCGHAFCAVCLEGYIGRTKIGDSFECPTCREKLAIPDKGLTDFRNKFYVISNDLEEVLPCEVCGSRHRFNQRCIPEESSRSSSALPDMRNSSHKSVNNNVPNKLINGFIESKDTCINHPNRMVEYVCQRCSRMVCDLCRFTEHQNHPTKDLAEAAYELRRKLRQDAPDATSLNERLRALKQNMEAIRSFHLELSNDLVTETVAVRDKSAEVHLEVDRATKAIEMEISDRYNRVLAETEAKLHILKNEYATCSSYAENSDNMLEKSSNADVLRKAPLIMQLIHSIKKQELHAVEKRSHQKIFLPRKVGAKALKNAMGTVGHLPTSLLTVTDSKPSGTITLVLKTTLKFPRLGDLVYGIAPVSGKQAWICFYQGTSLHLIDREKGTVVMSLRLGTRCSSVCPDWEKGCFLACTYERSIKHMTYMGKLSNVTSALQHYPHGVAFRKSGFGQLYVTSTDYKDPIGHATIGEVSVVRQDDTVRLETICAEATGLERICVSKSSALICTSSHNGKKVFILDQFGKLQAEYDTSPNPPICVCFDNKDGILVATTENNELIRIKSDGAFNQTLLQGKVIRSLAVDEVNNLWVGLDNGKIEIYQILD